VTSANPNGTAGFAYGYSKTTTSDLSSTAQVEGVAATNGGNGVALGNANSTSNEVGEASLGSVVSTAGVGACSTPAGPSFSNTTDGQGIQTITFTYQAGAACVAPTTVVGEPETMP
jgi:hypothetical protein